MKKTAIIISSILCLIFSIVPLSAQENFDIASEYAILINLKDDQVLYEKNAEERMYPASMTKLMTVLTAMDSITDLKKEVTITNDMLEGLSEEGASVAGFSNNEVVTLEALIYGALLPSGADACRALAFHIAGSEQAFVELMNQKAKDLGLVNTHFENTTGLHDDNHYTTVKEMAEILKAAMDNSTMYMALTSETYTVAPTLYHPEGLTLKSTLRSQETISVVNPSVVIGGKTGFTLEGGLCLASFAELKDVSYILVTGNAGTNSSVPQHILDAYTIYDFMMNTYDYKEVLSSNSEIANIKVRYNIFHHNLGIELEEPLSALVNKNYKLEDVKVSFDGNLEIEAPIEEGQFLGNIQVTYNGEVLKEIPFHAQSDIGRNWLWYGAARIIDFIVSIRYILLSIVIVFISWVAYRRYKVLQRRKRRRQQRRK